MSVLEISDLHKQFVAHLRDGQPRAVLRGVELALEPGTLTMLRGPSGSGKSSLLRCVYRTYLPDRGTVLLALGDEPVDLARAGDQAVLDIRRRLLGMVGQFLRVTPRVSAVDLVAEVAGADAPARELLGSLGLSAELHDAVPATFSGGERQVVNLAMALARPRPMLLLDEATASLDPRRRRRVLEVLEAEKARGTTMLAVFHDMPDVPGIVDRVLEMRDGRVAA